MSPGIATIVYVLGIVGLFILDRDRKSRTSGALWIPVVWMLIAGSRPVSLWFQTGNSLTSAEKVNIESNPVNVVVFSALLAVGVIVLAGRAARVSRLLQADWPIPLFFIYCAISAVWSDYPGASFRHWIRSLGDPAMVLIVLTESEPPAALKRIFTRTGFLLVPLSVLLIKYYPNLGRAYSNDFELMYTGVTDHKNSLGGICFVFGLGFSWSLLEHYRSKEEFHRSRRLLAHGAILATTMWLLWMANSVTSSSCFAIGAILFAATSLSVHGRRVVVMHTLVAALVSAYFFALFLDSGGVLVTSLGRNPSLTGRTEIWSQVLKMAGNPVVGTGFESFWLGDRLKEFWDNNTGSQINEAHNGYLEVYLNLGWIGVALLAALIVKGYHNIVSSFHRDIHLGGLRLGYFVAMMVYNFTEAGFRMSSFTWIFLLLLTFPVRSTPAPKSGAERAFDEVPHSRGSQDIWFPIEVFDRGDYNLSAASPPAGVPRQRFDESFFHEGRAALPADDSDS